MHTVVCSHTVLLCSTEYFSIGSVPNKGFDAINHAHAYWGNACLTAEAGLLAGLVIVWCEAADGPGWSHLHAAERPDPCD